MVSHSLNLFWFADVYPTVSHKNCPKKKKNLGPVYWKSPQIIFPIPVKISLALKLHLKVKKGFLAEDFICWFFPPIPPVSSFSQSSWFFEPMFWADPPYLSAWADFVKTTISSIVYFVFAQFFFSKSKVGWSPHLLFRLFSQPGGESTPMWKIRQLGGFLCT